MRIVASFFSKEVQYENEWTQQTVGSLRQYNVSENFPRSAFLQKTALVVILRNDRLWLRDLLARQYRAALTL